LVPKSTALLDDLGRPLRTIYCTKHTFFGERLENFEEKYTQTDCGMPPAEVWMCIRILGDYAIEMIAASQGI